MTYSDLRSSDIGGFPISTISPRQVSASARVIGRDAELSRISQILDRLPTSGETLLLCGEPGVGKSTLLDWAADTMAGRGAVSRLGGVETEASLPFAALAELLLPLRAYFDDLAGAQRTALEAALALSDDPVKSEQHAYAVCVGALNTLSLAGQCRPLLVLIDDLQWVDKDSRQVILFLARRLAQEPVALLAAARTPPSGSEDLPRLDVGGLTTQAAAKLLHARGLTLAPTVASALLAFAQGNPLILVEFASGLNVAQRRGEEPLPELPDVGGRAERGWAARFRGLPPATRTALAIVAAARDGRLEALEPALLNGGVSLCDLTPAEHADLLTATDQQCEFVHPILRGIALRAISTVARREAYRALAEATAGATRAWYLAAAAIGRDEIAAGALVDAATEARRRGSYLEAASAGHRASELTGDPEERVARLLTGATDALTAGSCDDVVRWCVTVEGLSVAPELQADVALLYGRALTWLGQANRAREVLSTAAARIESFDRQRACILFAETTLPAMMVTDHDQALQAADRCAALSTAPEVTDPGSAVHVGITLSLVGQIKGAVAALERAVDALPEIPTTAAVVLAEVAFRTERYGQAHELLRGVLNQAGRGSPPSAVMYAFCVRGEMGWWQGQWNAAYADGLQAQQQAQTLGQRANHAYAALILARMDVARGDRGQGAGRLAVLLDDPALIDMKALRWFARTVQGIDALTHGACDEAVVHLDYVFRTGLAGSLGNPNYGPFAADLIEAHTRAGNRDAAAEVLSWLEDCSGAAELAWPTVAVARSRAILTTDPDQAETHYEVALAAHQRVLMPYEHARTLLNQGTSRRRARQKAKARAPLLAAYHLFTALGARPWAARCQAELAASGHHETAPSPSPSPNGLDVLTPQELQVARMVANGLTNAEIGLALFISNKTVESHLTHIYRKLRLRSRSALSSLVAVSGLHGQE